MPIDQDMHEIIQRAANELKLGTIQMIDAILPAYRNHSYRMVTEQGVYICRKHYEHKPHKIVEWEHGVMQYAMSKGVNTPALCGTYLEGRQLFSVYPYVNGETLRNLPLTAELAYQAGIILGHLHSRFQGWQPQLCVTQSLDDALISDVKAAPWKTVEWSTIPSDARQILTQFLSNRERLLTDTEPLAPLAPQEAQVVHGDFQGGNLLVANPDWFVLDWESSFYGDPMFDIGKSLLFLCKLAEEVGCYQRSKAFLNGYSQHALLTFDRLRRALWHMCYNVAAGLPDVLACALYDDLRLIPLIERNSQRIEVMIQLKQARAFVQQLPELLLPSSNRLAQ